VPTPSKAVWSSGPNSARDDYKEFSHEVRVALLEAAETVLVPIPRAELSADEGFAGDGMMYRRAVSREQMAALETVEDGDESTPITVNYYFIYRLLTGPESAHYNGATFMIQRIVDNLKFAWLFERTLVRNQG